MQGDLFWFIIILTSFIYTQRLPSECATFKCKINVINLCPLSVFSGSASLFLSAMAFLSPYDHLTGFEPSYRVVQGYMAYLSDSTRLITNPGLKRAVRDDVAMASRVTAHWRRRLMEAATTSRYTVRT